MDPTDDPREKTFKRDVLFAIAMASNLLAFLLLVAMPGAPSSFLFLIAMASNLEISYSYIFLPEPSRHVELCRNLPNVFLLFTEISNKGIATSSSCHRYFFAALLCFRLKRQEVPKQR